MGRTIGSIVTETLVTIPVQQNWVMTAKSRRYVFLALVQPKVYEATGTSKANRKLYDKFNRGTRLGLYNIVNIYGMQAIDIDEPQVTLVSVRLKFAIVRSGSDAVSEVKEIKKSAL
jgi:hypothetical protein